MGEHKKSHFGFLALACLVVVGLGAGVYYEWSVRQGEQKALAATVERTEETKPVVSITGVRMAPSDGTIELPGQTVALVETPLYTRTDGYLKSRTFEIGKHVRKGDQLIELDTPDLDQQIAQARATLAQSQAALAQLQAAVQSQASNLKLARITADRTKKLAEQGVVAAQEYDNRESAVETAEANVHAAEESVRAQQSLISANDANLKRLLEQKNYAHIDAPFDGIMTYRNPAASEIGTLISAGSNTAAREIMRISQIDVLRIFVNVPQSYAPFVQLNAPADLLFDEFPSRTFRAKVHSVTNSVDPTTRTMLTVLHVDNPQETLLPGMYTKVRFKFNRNINVIRLPADALLNRTEGPVAAVVDADNRVHMTKLTLGRDFGPEVEVTSGLSKDDRVVQNPTDAIREGVVIQPKENKR